MKPDWWYRWVHGSDAGLYMPRNIRAHSALGLRLHLLSAMSRRRLYGLGLAPAPGLYFLNMELLVSLAMIGFFLLSVNGSDVVLGVLFFGPLCALLVGRRTNTVVYEVTLNRQSSGGVVRFLSSGKDYNADFRLPSKMPDVSEIDLGFGFDFFGPLRYWGVIVTTDIGPLLLCTAEDQEAAQKEAREVKEFLGVAAPGGRGNEDTMAANESRRQAAPSDSKHVQPGLGLGGAPRWVRACLRLVFLLEAEVVGIRWLGSHNRRRRPGAIRGPVQVP